METSQNQNDRVTQWESSQKQSDSKVLLILFIGLGVILLAGAVGVGGYFLGKSTEKEETEGTETEEEDSEDEDEDSDEVGSQTEELEPADPYEGWESYGNEYLDIESIRYPSDWGFEEGSMIGQEGKTDYQKDEVDWFAIRKGEYSFGYQRPTQVTLFCKFDDPKNASYESNYLNKWDFDRAAISDFTLDLTESGYKEITTNDNRNKFRITTGGQVCILVKETFDPYGLSSYYAAEGFTYKVPANSDPKIVETLDLIVKSMETTLD